MMPASQAVEALIHEYGKLVFHTIYGLTGDWEESQDLTQDTFHQALKAIDAARESSGAQFNAKAWLLRIALNTVRMQQRRRRLFRFIPFSRIQKDAQGESERMDETTSEALNAQAAPVQPAGYGATASADPGDLVSERDAVQRTMQQLPESLRICLLLSVVGNFSITEIAQMLDLNEAAVRQRLSRARKQFQQFYTSEHGEEPAGNATRQAAEADRQKTTYQHHEERVESRVSKAEADYSILPSSSNRGRTYAARLYRGPAVTPLW